jgi:uncharacterized membrane protein YhaH (DUF805 family)
MRPSRYTGHGRRLNFPPDILKGAVMDAADFKTLMFSFRGRINRGKWWLALVVFIVYGVITSVVAGVVFGTSLIGSSEIGATAVVGIGIMLIAYLAALVAGIAVGVKRLHDRNKSGWWLLLFYILPAVLSGVGEASGNAAIASLLALIAVAIYVWGFVELACLRGTVGPNKYGPDPLASDQTQPVATV